MCLGVFLLGFTLYGTLCASWTWLFPFPRWGNFQLCLQKLLIPFLFLFFFWDTYNLNVGMFFLGFILYGTLCASWTWLTISFSILGKFSTIISSKIFSYPFFFSSSSGIPLIQMFIHLIFSQRSLKVASVLFILFTLFYSSEIISTILTFSSLVSYSVSDILLLIPSRVFLISVIVLSLYAYSLILLGLC